MDNSTAQIRPKPDGSQLRRTDLFVKSADMTLSPHLATTYSEQIPLLPPSASVNGPPSWFLPRGDTVCMLLSVMSSLGAPLSTSPPPRLPQLDTFTHALTCQASLHLVNIQVLPTACACATPVTRQIHRQTSATERTQKRRKNYASTALDHPRAKS